MTVSDPDRSRDRRIEDFSNLWIIHPAARSLLPWFVARGISANAVSMCGLLLGALAALAFSHWDRWPFACIGLLLSLGWLVCDGLDGLIARATGTSSAFGRALDGMCDHGVFALIYVGLALSLGTVEAWILGACAGAAHAVQSNLYESERARFHRRCRGVASAVPAPSRNPLVRLYDHVAGMVDRFADPFDRLLANAPDPVQLGRDYGVAAVNPQRLMSLLSANIRVYAIFLACLAGNPALFWWFELIPLSLILFIGLFWHRTVESRFVRSHGAGLLPFKDSPDCKDVTN